MQKKSASVPRHQPPYFKQSAPCYLFQKEYIQASKLHTDPRQKPNQYYEQQALLRTYSHLLIKQKLPLTYEQWKHMKFRESLIKEEVKQRIKQSRKIQVELEQEQKKQHKLKAKEEFQVSFTQKWTKNKKRTVRFRSLQRRRQKSLKKKQEIEQRKQNRNQYKKWLKINLKKLHKQKKIEVKKKKVQMEKKREAEEQKQMKKAEAETRFLIWAAKHQKQHKQKRNIEYLKKSRSKSPLLLAYSPNKFFPKSDWSIESKETGNEQFSYYIDSYSEFNNNYN